MGKFKNKILFEENISYLRARALKNLTQEKEESEILIHELKKEEERMVRIYIKINMNGKTIPLKKFINDLEKKLVVQVLKMVKGNQKKASYILGVKPTTLNEKIKRYKIRLI